MGSSYSKYQLIINRPEHLTSKKLVKLEDIKYIDTVIVNYKYYFFFLYLKCLNFWILSI